MTPNILEDALAQLHLQNAPPAQEQDDQEEETDQEQHPSSEISPFPFFDLPYEIRRKIYIRILFQKETSSNRPKITGISNYHHIRGETKTRRRNGNVGSSSRNKALAPLSHRLALFLANRRVHDEATYIFYSAQVFRVFPIQDYSGLPTLSNLSPTYRPLITTIELILGSSWTKPPKSWRVNEQLGLRQMTGLRTLKVFVQCDPSHPLFEGFRVSSEFYTSFAADLLRRILEQLPNLVQVEFDAWPSVQKRGPLMSGLLAEVQAAGKKVLWGPERGWGGDWHDRDEEDGLEKQTGVPEPVLVPVL